MSNNERNEVKAMRQAARFVTWVNETAPCEEIGRAIIADEMSMAASLVQDGAIDEGDIFAQAYISGLDSALR